MLEGHIGIAYESLGEYDLAISHHTNSIQIEDRSAARINRARLYFWLGQCEKAIIDAKAALALEPVFTKGIHTDAEANYILSDCYFWDEQYLLSLKHIDAALVLMKEHQYSDWEISFFEDEREAIASYLE